MSMTVDTLLEKANRKLNVSGMKKEVSDRVREVSRKMINKLFMSV
ncbi:hypothetical protein ACQKCU_24820 [Heyndrickxia sporothermodurans]